MGERQPRGGERRRLLSMCPCADQSLITAVPTLAPSAHDVALLPVRCASPFSSFSCASAVRVAHHAATAAMACSSATRGATPTRTLRCLTRPGWGRMEGERRPAGAGLGSHTSASAMAIAAGQPRVRMAAPATATGGSGGERSLEWWVSRGPPDMRSRPHTMLTLSLLDWGVVPGRRREEPSFMRL